MIRLALFVLAVLPWAGQLAAAEIQGKVTKVSGSTITVTLSSEELPNPGDKVEVFMEIPGLGDKAMVARATVTSVAGEQVVATIDRATGRVAAGQEVKILSDSPRKPTAPAKSRAGTGRPSPAAPQAPAGSIEPSRSALAGPTETTGQIVRTVAAMLPKYHLSRRLLDDDVSRRWLKKFFATLDPGKWYFTQPDVDRFTARQDELDDLARQGDVQPAYEIFRVYLHRVDERTRWMEELAAAEHDFTIAEEIAVDPKAARYVADQNEARDLCRRWAKYWLLVAQVEGNPEQAARQDVVRRYESIRQRAMQIDDEELLAMYLTALAQAYDPQSRYFSPKEAEEFAIQAQGRMEGIGAALRGVEGEIVVTQVISGSPSARDGRLKAGDRIVAVGQGESGPLVSTAGRKLSDLVSLIRGEAGSIVRLQVVPKGQTDAVVYGLVRDKLQPAPLRSAVIERGQKADGTPVKVGYIRLPTLYSSASLSQETGSKKAPKAQTSTGDVLRILEDPQRGFKAGGADLVILDLRGNPGGPLAEAIELPGLFLGPVPVVQEKDAQGKLQTHSSSVESAVWEGPLVVLVDAYSGPGAEIVAGAIQDHERGLIVGCSAGSGNATVQGAMFVGKEVSAGETLPKLGILRVTRAQFYLPSGRTTNNRGLAPDVELPALRSRVVAMEREMAEAFASDEVEAVNHAHLGRVKPEHVKDLQARSEQRRSNSPQFLALAERIRQQEARWGLKAVVLNEESVRQWLQAAEEPFKEAPPAAKFPVDYVDEEILAIALDYLRPPSATTLDGTWEAVTKDADGNVVGRIVKEVRGNHEKVTIYGKGDEVVTVKENDFALEQVGDEKVFRFFNGRIIAPEQKKGQTFQGAYVYRLEGDRFIEEGRRPGGKDKPSYVLVFTR